MILEDELALELTEALYGYFTRRRMIASDAWDAVQEVLFRLLRRRASAPCSSQLRHHTFAVAKQVFCEWQRRSVRRCSSLVGAEVVDPTPDRRSQLDEFVQERCLREALLRLVPGLRPSEREFVVRIVHFGCTSAEAGALLGMPASTARGMRERILKKAWLLDAARSSQ